MATYPIALTNPGAESGSITGWTQLGEGVVATTGGTPHSGTYHFYGNIGFNEGYAGMYQIANVDPSMYAMIDNYELLVYGKGWHKTQDVGSPDDPGVLTLTLYSGENGTGTVLATTTTGNVASSSYTQRTTSVAVPAGTRSIKITAEFYNGDFNLDYASYWDDFELYFDDTGSVSAYSSQLGAYALGIYPAAEARGHQVGLQVVSAAETSNTFHDVKAYQLGAYALVKSFPDRRDLRAWTFPQDDHKFYVIQLGDNGTLVYDKLSQQWADWRSPGYNYWRTNDGTDWEGYNVACDNRSGKVWRIDPLGRLDYETTPITSQVTGGITFRQRTNIPCYSAELAISAGQPITSLPEGSTGITLRTSDNSALDFVDHGEIAAGPFGEQTVIRWYGLGLMKAPGHYFEITDTGYARRIDGLTIEIGGTLDGQ